MAKKVREVINEYYGSDSPLSMIDRANLDAKELAEQIPWLNFEVEDSRPVVLKITDPETGLVYVAKCVNMVDGSIWYAFEGQIYSKFDQFVQAIVRNVRLDRDA